MKSSPPYTTQYAETSNMYGSKYVYNECHITMIRSWNLHRQSMVSLSAVNPYSQWDLVIISSHPASDWPKHSLVGHSVAQL